MHRCYFCLTLLFATTALPVSAVAEATDEPVVAHLQNRNQGPVTTAGGFAIDLPAVSHNKLIELVRTYQVFLVQRQQEVARYLDENRLGAKDTLITVIMPGGLLYALVKEGKLDQARDELAEINKDMDELSHDLLAIQTARTGLTVAQLQ